MSQPDLLPHLFRKEFSKITAVLCKHFGLDHVETAEDIASETFLAALESWTYKGIPPNPTAWLYQVAKNKASNYRTRSIVLADKVAPILKAEQSISQPTEVDLSGQNITDSQLQMLFAICHPAIPAEAQIALALRILCGFGIDEIATAFLTTKEVVNKRLHRAREKLRDENVSLEFPNEGEIRQRLNHVLTSLYLLFSEGYYSESYDGIVRKDLCLDAIRLTHLLLENPSTDVPSVSALLSLMCLHASRLESRKSPEGEIILYRDQDEALWNKDLITRGTFFLHKAAQGEQLTNYHLEATIAYWHTIKADTAEKWGNILKLYDQLVAMDRSPIVGLNRIFAIYKVKGSQVALAEALVLNLRGNRYYHALLGELYLSIDIEQSKANLKEAIVLAKTTADRMILQKKLNSIS